VVERVERDGDSVVFAVLKEGAPDIIDKLEPGCGEARRGVPYEEEVGERREDCWRGMLVVGELSGWEVAVGDLC
jgi:hypothetical protein